VATSRSGPNGKYRSVAYASIDPLTRKKRYLKKTVDTSQQAEIELTRLLSQIDERRHPRSAVTAGEVVDRWLDVADLAVKTRRRYVQLIDAYIKPTFGDRPVAELDVELLERFYARLQRCNKLCSGTPPTRSHMQAAERQHHPPNPLHHPRVTRSRSAVEVPRHERSRLSRSTLVRAGTRHRSCREGE
jgi:hypothetical protein